MTDKVKLLPCEKELVSSIRSAIYANVRIVPHGFRKGDWLIEGRSVDDAAQAVLAAIDGVVERVKLLETALFNNGVALNAFIECVGGKMKSGTHYRWHRFPTFEEVQAAMEANNAARAAMKDAAND